MIRAVIFDFTNVIADDETPHLRCFKQALAEHGLSFTKDDYYGRYLGMDERSCAVVLLAARDGTCDRDLPRAIMNWKATHFREYTTIHKPALFPCVVEFVKRAKAQYRLAIATGGRREQVDHALHGAAIERNFTVIVSGDDVAAGKSGPALYYAILKRLTAVDLRPPLLIVAQWVVVEDFRAGIRVAKASGMRVLALGACPTLPFVTRRRRCGQMRGRRPGKTGDVFAGILRSFLAENDADGRGSFTAVERSMSDRLLTTFSPRTTDRSRSRPAEFERRASRIEWAISLG